MKAFTLLVLTITTIHYTSAGLGGITVLDLECDELLNDPKYKGRRCTIRDITTKRTAFNWHKLTHPEIVFINTTMPYIPTDFKMEMAMFELVDLTDVKLQFIDKSNFELGSKLNELYLAKNFLDEIPANSFSGTPALKVLDLSENEIEHIDTNAFSGLKSLLQLDLNGNGLKSIDFSQLSDLVQLRKLNLGYNALTVLDVTDIKKHLPRLEWIGLKGSKIECSEIKIIGQKLREVSVFNDVIDDLTGEVLEDADCIRPAMAEMWFD